MESIERLEARARVGRASQRVGEPSSTEASVPAVRIVKGVSLDPAYGCVDWFGYESNDGARVMSSPRVPAAGRG